MSDTKEVYKQLTSALYEKDYNLGIKIVSGLGAADYAALLDIAGYRSLSASNVHRFIGSVRIIDDVGNA